jgi:DNA-binding XRE family transcriptional regulator
MVPEREPSIHLTSVTGNPLCVTRSGERLVMHATSVNDHRTSEPCLSSRTCRPQTARLLVLTYGQDHRSVSRMRDPLPDWVLAYRRTVGHRIAARRHELRRPQTWVCEATGVDRTTFQRIELGLADPRLGVLALIAAALDVPIERLVEGGRPEAPQ